MPKRRETPEPIKSPADTDAAIERLRKLGFEIEEPSDEAEITTLMEEERRDDDAEPTSG